MMPIAIYFANILVAEKHGDFYVAVEGIPRHLLPPCFVLDNRQATAHGVLRWMHERILPKERNDIQCVLSEMELPTYDATRISELTHCGAFVDYWWASFSAEDNFLTWCFKAVTEDIYFTLAEDKEVHWHANSPT